MPVGDILTILMVARSILSDCVIQYTSVCPQCNRPNPGKVAIPDELVPIGKKALDFPGYDTVTLPDCKDEVAIRVLTVGEEVRIMERSKDDKALLPDGVATILFSVEAVGGGRPADKEEALTWYNALSPKDANELRKKRAALTPQLDPDLTIKCDGCGHIFTHTLDLQRDFFRGD
jgi:hypothetical protein